MTRRLTHTSHHRGQQMAMLRMLGRSPAQQLRADRRHRGLMQNHAPTIYAYDEPGGLAASESISGKKSELPGSAGKPVTERPDSRNN